VNWINIEKLLKFYICNLLIKKAIMETNSKNYQFNSNISSFYSGNRKIPIGIQIKIWFGNVLTILGLAFFIMGLPFTFAFISFSTLFGPSFNEKDPTAKALVLDVNSTNSSINDVTVYKYNYQFQTDDGKTYNGQGFSTGKVFNTSDLIVVNYKSENPELSKAVELRSSEFGGGIGFFVLIFPLIGLIMLFFSIRKAIKQISILKIGELAEGKLLFKTPTNTKINNQTVYALTFEFKATDGQVYQAVTKTHLYQRLEDEQLEKLVYDPDKPSNAVLLDALPKGMKEYFLNNF
jgi:hypothetical protein